MNYEKWLETERAYGGEVARQERKKFVKWMIIIAPATIVIICGIGLLAGGVEGAINNIKYSLIIAVFMELLVGLCILTANPTKRLIKLLKKEVARELPTEAQREAFAEQMLGKGGAGSVRKFADIDSTKREERVFVTKDYLYFAPSSRFATIVRLKEVEHIEVDSQNLTNYIKAGNTTVHVNSTVYPILFYYHKTQNSNKKKNKCDKTVTLEYRGTRDSVIEAIQELNGESEQFA